MFMFGKMIKYMIWFSTAYYFYHLFLVLRTDKPENGFLVESRFLDAAYLTTYNFQQMRIFLTRPPVDSLLPERMPLPPGYAHPKTLVLNLQGTLLHSEYIFGKGFEIVKRPGLSMFLNTLGR